MKRKSSHQATKIPTKRLRSKLPRRRRINPSPIVLLGSPKPPPAHSKSIALNSTCSAVFIGGGGVEGESVYRRVTRSFRKRRENACAKEIGGFEVEVSENSCVESCSMVTEAETDLQSKGVGGVVIGGSKKVPARSVEFRGELLKIGDGKGNESAPISETCEPLCSEITGSCTNVCSNVCSNVLTSTSTIDQKTSVIAVNDDIDLVCAEQNAIGDGDDDLEVISSAMTLSEVQSELFASASEMNFSEDYTPSISLDTGSQFLEKSIGDSSQSHCFSLFKQFCQQLSRRSSAQDDDAQSRDDEDCLDDVTFCEFEDEDDEECYKKLRSRERKQPIDQVIDYAHDECDTVSEYGSMILEQRTLMVNWIIEVRSSPVSLFEKLLAVLFKLDSVVLFAVYSNYMTSHKRQLHDETMFLGVHLLDRFLTKAFFSSRRDNEALGISCLTLATRIEEKQPYNTVPPKTFSIGNNIYSRSEIVAMEWVVLEVLKFRCFTPTLHNFMGFYLKAADADEWMKQKAKYLAELALRDNRQLRYWPSTVAAVLVILVSLSADRQLSCQHVMETHMRTKVDDLPECLKV
ncbi:Cyclin-SDS-like protein [Drosera capensis]